MTPAERWPRGLRITKHAHETMARRDVDPEDIGEVLRDPQGVDSDGAAQRFWRDGLCVVVKTEGGVGHVLTVLLRTRDVAGRWTDEDVRRHMAQKRAT